MVRERETVVCVRENILAVTYICTHEQKRIELTDVLLKFTSALHVRRNAVGNTLTMQFKNVEKGKGKKKKKS